MSLVVLLPTNKILLGRQYFKLFQRTKTQFRRLHHGKAEIIENTANKNYLKNKHANNINLVNSNKFFSGTTQGGGEESAIQKIERISFMLLAKSMRIFETIRTSNEVSVIKAAGRKMWRLTKTTFQKNVVENEKVAAIRNDFKQKLEEAKNREKQN